MLQLKQLRYASDNFSYVIYGQKFAAVIDGGAVEATLTYVKSRSLSVKYVAHTHSHPDHTAGTQTLLKESRADFLGFETLCKHREIVLEGQKIRVLHTPGHTMDSVTFHLQNILITGDTLFNGTVGNCFSGDLVSFYNSVKQLMTYPEDTLVYAGHDYVNESMAYARLLEPDNPDIEAFLKTYDPACVRSTLGEELKINPFLRFNDPRIVALLEEKGLPTASELQRWKSLMQMD